MTEIIASAGRVIRIGYEGEDSVTKIIFPYDETWLDCGEGDFYVRVLRKCDTEAYNAVSVVDNPAAMTLTLTVTDVELSVKGYGEMQVVYAGADFVKKGPVYGYYVSRAIDGEVIDPPEGSIINQIVRHLAEVDDTIGDMQTALAGKADTTYVDTQLAGKASTATATASSDGLMSAQDKTRLDAMYADYTAAFDALGGGT